MEFYPYMSFGRRNTLLLSSSRSSVEFSDIVILVGFFNRLSAKGYTNVLIKHVSKAENELKNGKQWFPVELENWTFHTTSGLKMREFCLLD